MDKAKHDEEETARATKTDESSADETSGNGKENTGESRPDGLGKQSSASSGTTSLSSESSDSNDKTAPGGVEGASGNS